MVFGLVCRTALHIHIFRVPCNKKTNERIKAKPLYIMGKQKLVYPWRLSHRSHFYTFSRQTFSVAPRIHDGSTWTRAHGTSHAWRDSAYTFTATNLHCARNGRRVHGETGVSYRSQEYNAVFFSHGIRSVLRHRIRSVARIVKSYFRTVFTCGSFNDTVCS
jgi:hypothetical protein